MAIQFPLQSDSEIHWELAEEMRDWSERKKILGLKRLLINFFVNADRLSIMQLIDDAAKSEWAKEMEANK